MLPTIQVDDEIAEVRMRRMEMDGERDRIAREMAKEETERNREIERQRERELRERKREEKVRVKELERKREQEEREDATQKRELRERELQKNIVRELELEKEIEQARALKLEEEASYDAAEDEEEEGESMAPFLLKQTQPSSIQGRRARSQSADIGENASNIGRIKEVTAFKGEYDMSGAGGLKAILGSQSSGVRALTKAEIRAELARVSTYLLAVSIIGWCTAHQTNFHIDR